MFIFLKYKRKCIFTILIVILISSIWRLVIIPSLQNAYCQSLFSNNTSKLRTCYDFLRFDKNETLMYIDNAQNSSDTKSNPNVPHVYNTYDSFHSRKKDEQTISDELQNEDLLYINKSQYSADTNSTSNLPKVYNTYHSSDTRNKYNLLSMTKISNNLNINSTAYVNEGFIDQDEQTTNDESILQDEQTTDNDLPLCSTLPTITIPTTTLPNPAHTEKLWRDDGRCGVSYPLPSGQPGQCDPKAKSDGKGPCCSSHGWCGNSHEHCQNKGKLLINMSPPNWSVMNENLAAVSMGGKYSPTNCKPGDSVAIVVPYRDRPDHLRILINHIHPFLMRQNLHYQVFVINQAGNLTFNKARLMNAGFLEALKINNWKCFIFHDVDLLPEDDRNLYNCPDQPRHLGILIDTFKYKLVYSLGNYFFGGVGALLTEHFKLLNGYSNEFWGWGAEDEEMTLRIKYNGLNLTRHSNWNEVSRYTMIRHRRDKLNPSNPKRMKILRETKKRIKDKKDGLSSLNYQLVGVFPEKLFTNITIILSK